ncbi:AC4 protein [Escherichia phage IMM-002]|uniref:AC4 protein n=1 Tax=Escherichia phage IMM-002 TaxID=2041760 RepID=A0A384WIL8_9CAUD|nr:AC4 protein [Escherichia phage IMM-002]ATI17042.1 AC4 protein [Escherichia phage IMM-002]
MSFGPKVRESISQFKNLKSPHRVTLSPTQGPTHRPSV